MLGSGEWIAPNPACLAGVWLLRYTTLLMRKVAGYVEPRGSNHSASQKHEKTSPNGLVFSWLAVVDALRSTAYPNVEVR